jgi:hypothetical protein
MVSLWWSRQNHSFEHQAIPRFGRVSRFFSGGRTGCGAGRSGHRIPFFRQAGLPGDPVPPDGPPLVPLTDPLTGLTPNQGRARPRLA